MYDRIKLQLYKHYYNGHYFFVMLVQLYKIRFWGWNPKYGGFNVKGRFVILGRMEIVNKR